MTIRQKLGQSTGSVHAKTMNSCAGTARTADKSATAKPARTREQVLHRPATANWSAHQLAASSNERLAIEVRDTLDSDRGKLGSLVREAVEDTLVRHGAVSRNHRSQCPLSSYLVDAAYRARLLGAGGLALAFGQLGQLGGSRGVLSESDSEVVRTLLACAQEHTLHIFFQPTDQDLAVLGTPVPLSQWLPARDNETTGAVIEYESQPVALDSAGSALDGSAPATSQFSIPCPAELPSDTLVDSEAAVLASDSPEAIRQSDDTQCLAWAKQLEEMSGRKVHGAIEKAFASAYMPLLHEVSQGTACAQSRQAVARWGEDFAQSYSSAFDSVKHHNRRPKMVSDINQVAARWAEQHRVTQCELLVVSSLRFDLGERLRAVLEEQLAASAVCAEACLLWSSLPSNGRSQRLDSSPDAHSGPPARDATPGRGGPFTMHRLSYLDSELTRPGPHPAQRLNAMAQQLGGQIAPWLAERKANSLVVVFGDHGFALASNDRGTLPAGIGGALPEQVLVPAYAWIVGADRRNYLPPPHARTPNPSGYPLN